MAASESWLRTIVPNPSLALLVANHTTSNGQSKQNSGQGGNHAIQQSRPSNHFENQLLPFADDQVLKLFAKFESGLYAAVA